MKDEEMAEEYRNKNCERWETDGLSVDEIAKENYLAGLKAGKPQWHKIADGDFPKKLELGTCSKTVVNQIGTPCHYNYSLQCWQNWSYIEIETPIAWCEIPTFNKE